MNACTKPDLFWAIKGGGGGIFGVLTRLTLRTRDLPATFGGVFGRIRASSDAAHRDLIARFLDVAETFLTPQWGEQVAFGPDNSLQVALVFQDLDQAAAEQALARSSPRRRAWRSRRRRRCW